MSSRERFRETMSYGRPDRVPYFEEGIREDVLKAWRTQGLAKATDLKTMFLSDHRERMQVDLEPRPKLVSKLDKITNLKNAEVLDNINVDINNIINIMVGDKCGTF